RARGEPWYQAKLREAAARMGADDPLAAIHILEAILVLEPDCPAREQIRALTIQAKELLVRLSVIEARVVAERVLLGASEPIRLVLELENVSDEVVRIEHGAAESEATPLGALELELYEVDLT